MSTSQYILLVDDHSLLQHALAAVLEPVLNGGRVVSACTAQEAIDALRSGQRFDLILLDLKLPDSDGIRLFSNLRREAISVPIAIFSGQDAPIYRQLAREAGADGFLGKALPPDALVQAIRLLLSGRRFFDEGDRRFPTETPVKKSNANLSTRQQRVLSCLLEGLTNKEIGQRLDLSERTVKMHLTGIFHALGVTSRSQAILVGKSLDLPDIDSES